MEIGASGKFWNCDFMDGDSISILSFIFDRWEFILGVLLSAGASSYVTYKITIKKNNHSKINQDGEHNQATSVNDSPSSPPQTAGGDASRQDGQNNGLLIQNSPNATVNFGSPTIGDPAEALGPTPVNESLNAITLNYNQAHILNKVQEVIQRLNITSSFSERYQNAINHLNNNSAQVCASEYHSAFMDLVTVFVDQNTYTSQQPTTQQRTEFETSFTQVKTFMNDSSHDLNALRVHINRFEDSLIILLGFI